MVFKTVACVSIGTLPWEPQNKQLKNQNYDNIHYLIKSTSTMPCMHLVYECQLPIPTLSSVKAVYKS